METGDGLSIVVVVVAGLDSMTLLSTGILNSLWGSVGPLLVGVLTIPALWLARAWFGIRT